MHLAGLCGYFWVDRLRRKVAYWEVSINLIFSICMFLKFVLLFQPLVPALFY